MTPDQAESRHTLIDALTGIRALAAAWVLVEHFRFELFALLPVTLHLRPWIESGYLGVEIFFVLSGFIISHNYAAKMGVWQRAVYRDYLVNRLARIYPVHIVTLLGVALLVLAASLRDVPLLTADNYSVRSFVGNLLLLQAVPGFDAWNRPAWSISTEFAAYAVFPLIAALLLPRLRTVRTAGQAALTWLVLGCGAMMLVVLVVPPGGVGWTLVWVRIATEFVAGCLLWRAWSLAGQPRTVVGDRVAVVALLSVVVALPLLAEHPGAPLLTTPALAFFVAGCAAASGRVDQFFSHRAMLWGGRISYSLYMTHFVVLTVLEKGVPWRVAVDAALPVRLLVVVVLLGGCVALAWVTYLLVESPGRHLVRRVGLRSEAPRPPLSDEMVQTGTGSSSESLVASSTSDPTRNSGASKASG